ncbi:MAG: DUF971 domain-containing protein [Gammaproteobacteria bacterium]|nr:DUF971 domain-containing protein [Gammaproteobacteria bacterium]
MNRSITRPKEITYHKRSKVLELAFADSSLEIPAELLRVYSPSAEVRGHSADERKLQTGKKHVSISSIEPVGNYAIRIVFDDGHDTGLYGWEFLLDLGENIERYWREYLNDVKAANASRLPTIPVGHWAPSKTDAAAGDGDATGTTDSPTHDQ